MKKSKCIAVVVLCTILLSLLTACGQTGVETSTPITSITTTPGPQSLSLINGEISVDAETNYSIHFLVDANMKDVTVEGKFNTTDGRPNIEVYIMDDATFADWIKGKSDGSTIIFDSQKKSMGFINESIDSPGSYQLIFTNWSPTSYSPSQGVLATVDLKWTY